MPIPPATLWSTQTINPTAWNIDGDIPPTAFLLLEDEGFLLLEDGGMIGLE